MKDEEEVEEEEAWLLVSWEVIASKLLSSNWIGDGELNSMFVLVAEENGEGGMLGEDVIGMIVEFTRFLLVVGRVSDTTIVVFARLRDGINKNCGL